MSTAALQAAGPRESPRRNHGLVGALCHQRDRDRRRATIAPEPPVIAVKRGDERSLVGPDIRAPFIAVVGAWPADGVTVRFVVTDSVKQVAVMYKGPLPDLFREGKGVVTQGRLGEDGLFRASEVLAKHDENYMPPEAQHALDQAQKAGKTLSQ